MALSLSDHRASRIDLIFHLAHVVFCLRLDIDSVLILNSKINLPLALNMNHL